MLPLLELGVDDPVREPLPADTDTFQDTVTLQLVQHQRGIDDTFTDHENTFSENLH